VKIKQCIAARLLLSARSDDTDATSALEGATALDPTRSSRNVGISWRGPAAGVLESMPQHDKTSKEARGTVRLARNECHTLLLLHDKVRIILALLQAEARLTVAACPVGEFVPWGYVASGTRIIWVATYTSVGRLCACFAGNVYCCSWHRLQFTHAWNGTALEKIKSRRLSSLRPGLWRRDRRCCSPSAL